MAYQEGIPFDQVVDQRRPGGKGVFRVLATVCMNARREASCCTQDNEAASADGHLRKGKSTTNSKLFPGLQVAADRADDQMTSQCKNSQGKRVAVPVKGSWNAIPFDLTIMAGAA
jgi:hypothetical protein